jgi:hypothetical protein
VRWREPAGIFRRSESGERLPWILTKDGSEENLKAPIPFSFTKAWLLHSIRLETTFAS